MNIQRKLTWASLILFVLLVILSFSRGYWKISTVAIFGFISFLLGAAISQAVKLGEVTKLWAYGISSGAMITGAGAFLVPRTVSQWAQIGGISLGVGLILGYVIHEINHEMTSHVNFLPNSTITRLTIHSLLAGVILGSIYSSLPSMTILLGGSILLHKMPAGYVTTESLDEEKWDLFTTLLPPSIGVGMAAIIIRVLPFGFTGILQPIIFGIGSGIFIHVGIDLLPECSGPDGPISCARDGIRKHAIISTISGAIPIIVLAVLFF